MTQPIPYVADSDSLFFPSKNAKFFESGAPTSDPWLCAELSRLAYCEFEDSDETKSEVRNVLSSVGFPQCDFFSEKGTQGFVARSESKNILAFRGTEQVQNDPFDILTDAKVLQVTLSENRGKVHSGFHEALMWVHDRLDTLLETAEGTPLIFTGHSLGAALATLAAGFWRPTALFTFGSPRVGDDDFKSFLEGRNIDIGRYVDCCDLVTEVPPEKLPLTFRKRYSHVGKKFYIDRDGKILEEPDDAFVAEDQKEAHLEYFKEFSFVPGNVKIRSLADHAPLNYISAFTGRA